MRLDLLIDRKPGPGLMNRYAAAPKGRAKSAKGKLPELREAGFSRLDAMASVPFC